MLIEQWLGDIRQSSRSRLVRTGVMVVLVFLILATIVTVADGLGFATEISQYRNAILIGLLVLSGIIGVGVTVKELASNNRLLVQRLHNLKNEKEANEESLLKLMEAYKRNAYTEILGYLERLTILIAMRHEWENNGAKLVKTLIKPHSTAE